MEQTRQIKTYGSEFCKRRRNRKHAYNQKRKIEILSEKFNENDTDISKIQ